MKMEKSKEKHISPHVALISGALAGVCVDLTLFPLDTVKTRCQSELGFLKSGGFARLFSGIGPVAAGSAPGAAVFFLAYETGKSSIFPKIVENPVLVHALSASLAEGTSCLIRVPVEIIKQRMQVSAKGSTTSIGLLKSVLRAEGISGLFRGYTTTLLREVPFSFIQMPLWEWLKTSLAKKQQKEKVSPLQSALCGSLSASFSAVITCPLDVAKTRIMLAERSSEMAQRQSALFALKTVFAEKGIKGLFAGVGPRVAWISIGGAIFLGVYDWSVSLLTR